MNYEQHTEKHIFRNQNYSLFLPSCKLGITLIFLSVSNYHTRYFASMYEIASRHFCIGK